MIYIYYLELPPRSSVKTLFGIDYCGLGRFYTTQSDIGKVKETLKKKYCQIHEISKISEEKLKEYTQKP